ncbi:UNKNOWN [Stylonychia lemnae]|uniref:Uncharacterized protein n=1 Tax=Stylonychia lemnae TaxID=5949 RepID=A0A078AV97_STYLE|nr:UNKNOWN [Stylonychia lemnae]|eukprot:CDW85936.1 UNKNOWN [Stylonychia lemnae]
MQMNGIKQSSEESFTFSTRNDIRDALQDVNIEIMRNNAYNAYNETFKLQLAERKSIQEQELLIIQIEEEKELIKKQDLEIARLTKELETFKDEVKQKLLLKLKEQQAQELEKCELNNQFLIYSKFFNSIYSGLKNDSEQVDLNIFKDCQTLDQIISQLRTQKVNGKTYMEKILSQMASQSDEDIAILNRFVSKNTSNSSIVEELKNKWIILFSKPAVQFNNGTLLISGNVFSLSSVKSLYENDLPNTSEIYIIASEQLILDIDLKVPKVNVAIEANSILIKNSQCIIDTSPKDPPRLKQIQMSNYEKKCKKVQVDGQNGIAGDSAGNIMIIAKVNIQGIECLKLIANGANGQDGTDGLDGFDGEVYKDGIDGINFINNKEKIKQSENSGWGATHTIWYGTEGGLGSDGGHGGDAGVGGEGGHEGKISVIIQNEEKPLKFEQKKGLNGKDGVEGKGGKAGKDGKRGVEYYRFSSLNPFGGDETKEGQLNLWKKTKYVRNKYFQKKKKTYDIELNVIMNKEEYAWDGRTDYTKDQNGQQKNKREYFSEVKHLGLLKSMTNVTIFKQGPQTSNNLPIETFFCHTGQTEIIIPQIKDHFEIDEVKLIQYLQNLKKLHPSQIILIERYQNHQEN